VVRVKNKPQDVVFYCRLRFSETQPRPNGCGKRAESSPDAGLMPRKWCRNAWLWAVNGPGAGQSSKARPGGERGQGAGLVQLRWKGVEMWRNAIVEGSGLDSGLGRDHLLMDDAGDQDSTGHDAIEHDMFSELVPAQAHAGRIESSPHFGSLGKHSKTLMYSGGISRRLFRAPPNCGVPNNAANIGAGAVGNHELRQLFRPSPWLARGYTRKAH
jgi:hypothetical protein